ncbi:MAG: hypothetical protein NTW21_29015 [Verrucomicrobia bacterium]|nr:hypothetical protein [Verrucomicrobiota bacterium]
MQQRMIAWAAAAGLGAGTAWAAEAAVTLESLLREMTDCAAVARWPQPEYRCRHTGSPP